MKTKILTSVLALIFSSTIAFTQSKTKSDEKRSSSTKTEITKDSVYYSCSMHPDVKMDKPGKCSKCGMDLEKKTMKMTGAKSDNKDVMKEYACTMHPEVMSDMPGKCSKCGMDMEKKSMKMTGTKSENKEAMKTYSCSMHPEMKSEKPGRCSKCGMDLKVIK